MKLVHFVLAAAPFAFAAIAARAGEAGEAPRISGPHAHENLAVYFIHGESAPGAVPLTLAEALEKGRVQVLETGAVSELVIENLGGEDVFIQSGDIVKGGRQDRVLTTSLLLPPRSGKVPIASFCVEQGRWSARGSESDALFAVSQEVMPSRAAKLAMKTPPRPPAAGLSSGDQDNTPYALGGRQGAVWDSVSKLQNDLKASLDTDVKHKESESSLQLSLENEKLQEARAGYSKALEPAGAAGDIVGYVFAVNGRLNSADVYPSNGLFRKMWPKLLAASITEAISEKDGDKAVAPGTVRVAEFLAGAEKGSAQEQALENLMDLETRDADASLYVEARSRGGRWVHRSYTAK